MNVFRTKPRQELKARDELVGAGIEVVMPVEYRYGRRSQSVEHPTPKAKPVLTGYIITSDGRPKSRRIGAFVGSIRPDEAARMKRIDGRTVNAPPARSGIRAGDVVRVRKGPFAELQASVVAVKGRKATLVTWLFGRECQFTASVIHVTK